MGGGAASRAPLCTPGCSRGRSHARPRRARGQRGRLGGGGGRGRQSSSAGAVPPRSRCGPRRRRARGSAACGAHGSVGPAAALPEACGRVRGLAPARLGCAAAAATGEGRGAVHGGHRQPGSPRADTEPADTTAAAAAATATAAASGSTRGRRGSAANPASGAAHAAALRHATRRHERAAHVIPRGPCVGRRRGQRQACSRRAGRRRRRRRKWRRKWRGNRQ